MVSENLCQRFKRCELQGVSSRSALMNLLRAVFPWPALLEIASRSDFCIGIISLFYFWRGNVFIKFDCSINNILSK